MLQLSRGPAHLRPGPLSTIVSPGEQSQVREGGSCHDPRPTDGGHGNPFSFSGKWAESAQARGLGAENVGVGPHVAHSKYRLGLEGALLSVAQRNRHIFRCPQAPCCATSVSSVSPVMRKQDTGSVRVNGPSPLGYL